MPTFRTHPSLLPTALALALAAVVATPPARAGDAALDWNKAPRAANGVGTAPSGALVPAQRPHAPRAGGAIGARPVASAAVSSGAGLFALDDRAIIIVGGKNTTAGALKRSISAELAAKAGPPKTVKGGARKLDLAALDVRAAAAGQPDSPRTMERPRQPGGIKPGLVSQGGAAAPSALQAATVARPGVKDAVVGTNHDLGTAATQCRDKGAPQITEVAGRLKAGARVMVWGRCFGERPGRVEIIGQFPGGKLQPAFTAWDNSGVEIEIPATIRGAGDHVVALTIVSADGKASAAMQAQFVAARERVEVPANLWSPSAQFDFSATYGTRSQVGPTEGNEAYAGHTLKTLRVQPQCTLDTMDAVVSSGSISAIRGWEQGPANEASVTIDWTGVCTSKQISTDIDVVVAQSTPSIFITSACRVAFQTRAWAYCPIGVAP